jgi:hypothetical protein
MEMTPLQSWFLIYGESIPSPEKARETFQELYVQKMNEVRENGLKLIMEDDIGGMDELADDLHNMVQSAIQAANEEIQAGNKFPIDEVINETAKYLAARIMAEHE